MTFLKNNEKSTLGFRLAPNSSHYFTLVLIKEHTLRDVFQGLRLPLFGLWAHLTKFLVGLIGPFWIHFETFGHI
jgi:hypothetical protein